MDIKYVKTAVAVLTLTMAFGPLSLRTVDAQTTNARDRFGVRQAAGSPDRAGYFRQIADIALDTKGNIYVADQYRIQVFDNDGDFLRAFGSRGNGNGQFRNLCGTAGVAVDAAGSVYVSDWGNHRVEKFDRGGRFVRALGRFGSGPGQFNQPGALATDVAGNLYVLDRKNYRIQKFDRNGRFLLQMGRSGDGVLNRGNYVLREGELAEPSDIAVDSSGNVVVTENLENRIQMFNKSGKVVSRPGRLRRPERPSPRPFKPLHGTSKIAFDAANRIYLAQRSVRVFKWSGMGELITHFGPTHAGRNGAIRPAGIAVDAKGDVFVAYHDNDGTRIERFRVRNLPR